MHWRCVMLPVDVVNTANQMCPNLVLLLNCYPAIWCWWFLLMLQNLMTHSICIPSFYSLITTRSCCLWAVEQELQTVSWSGSWSVQLHLCANCTEQCLRDMGACTKCQQGNWQWVSLYRKAIVAFILNYPPYLGIDTHYSISWIYHHFENKDISNNCKICGKMTMQREYNSVMVV